MIGNPKKCECNCPSVECEEKECPNVECPKNEETTLANEELTKSELLSLFQTAMISGGFLKPEEVVLFDVQKVVYEGYYKDQENVKYYTVSGVYQCKNKDSSCMYQSQIGDVDDEGNYDFQNFMKVEERDGIYIVDAKKTGSYLFITPEEQDLFQKVGKEVS